MRLPILKAPYLQIPARYVLYKDAYNPKFKTLYSFSDLNCPFCKDTYPKILALYRKLSFNWGHVFYSVHVADSQTQKLNKAFYCADELRWRFKDRVLAANKTHVDPHLSNCIASDKAKRWYENQISFGESLGIYKTPFLVLEGVEVEVNSLAEKLK